MPCVNDTILHVDDDPLATRIVARQLQRYGIHTHSINDPTQAVGCIRGAGHRIVILDVDMPEVSGFDLLQEIKRLDQEIRVIMLTGRATSDTESQSQQFGADACFFKPLTDVASLADAIRAPFAIAKSRPARQKVGFH